jgi:hypothetical protein
MIYAANIFQKNYRMLPTLDKFYSLMSNKTEIRNTAMYLFYALDKDKVT